MTLNTSQRLSPGSSDRVGGGTGGKAVEFGILGPLQVSMNGTTMEVKGPKQRALLILLLLHVNEVVSTDKIVDALWGEDVNGREAATLRVHIANLRAALQPGQPKGAQPQLVVTQPPGYLLRIDPDAVDAGRFERLVAEGRRLLPDEPEPAAARFAEALSLWRGSSLEDVAYEAFAQVDIRRLDELRVSAIEDLIETELTMGRHSELVGRLESQVATHPLRERLWGQLMLALYRSGRKADALAAYRRLSDILGQELGLEPGPELRLLEERILLDAQGLTIPTHAIGLQLRPPAERTRLIGRAIESAELRSRLGSGRMLALTGTGGVGKTRLAQRIAWSLIEENTEVWWVELGGLSDPRLIPEQIAAAGGVSQGPNVETVDLLVRVLSSRELVVVLDNCEHLVDEAAQVVDRLLSEVPGLKIIATSREPLQVDGEMVWRVPSLPVPELITPVAEMLAFPSIELFVERARARGVEISRSGYSAVALICRRLDGNPLAIELAAARSTTFTPEEMSDRLADRFSLLERGGRTARARHRTLEATIDWSYRLLDEPDRRLLGRLAVFAAGFGLEAAKQVCASEPLTMEEVEAGVERLAEKSMIEYSFRGSRQSFRLTESVRDFAWDRLMDDPDQLLGRHRDWAVDLAITGGKGLLADEGRWFPILDGAYEEFRAAFSESLRRGEVDLALRLVGSVGGFLMWRRTKEALGWLETAVEAAEQGSSQVRNSTKALGLLAIGPFLCHHDRLEEGRQRLAEAAELYTAMNHTAGLMWVHYQQSLFPVSDDTEECVRHAQSAVDLARRLSDPMAMAYTLTRLAETRLLRLTCREGTGRGELETVISLCEEAKSYCRELPNAYASAMVNVVLGSALVLQGRGEEGLAHVEEGVRQRTRFALGVPCAGEFISAGRIALRFGHDDRSKALIRKGLEAFKGIGLFHAARSALVGAAAVLHKREPVVAARLLGVAGCLKRSFLYGTSVFDDEDQVVADVRSELGDAAYSAEAELGKRLQPSEGIELALTHIG
jgi:predicted ATPase/DNA-binding SARP family transcriptional activator